MVTYFWGVTHSLTEYFPLILTVLLIIWLSSLPSFSVPVNWEEGRKQSKGSSILNPKIPKGTLGKIPLLIPPHIHIQWKPLFTYNSLSRVRYIQPSWGHFNNGVAFINNINCVITGLHCTCSFPPPISDDHGQTFHSLLFLLSLHLHCFSSNLNLSFSLTTLYSNLQGESMLNTMRKCAALG